MLSIHKPAISFYCGTAVIGRALPFPTDMPRLCWDKGNTTPGSSICAVLPFTIRIATERVTSTISTMPTARLVVDLNNSLKAMAGAVLTCLRDCMAVRSFNLALLMPPIADVEENWEGFPALIRIVDRGDPGSVTSDIGTMELYAASVIVGDPFAVASVLMGGC